MRAWARASPSEALGELRVVAAQQLEGDVAAEGGIVGQEDGAHAARAQELQVAVAAERRAGGQRPLARDTGREARGLVGGIGAGAALARGIHGQPTAGTASLEGRASPTTHR